MESRNQRGELVLGNVLKFVDENRECSTSAARGMTRRFQQGLEIVFEVTVVGKARLGFEIEANLDVLIFHLQRPCESRQSAQRALSEFTSSFVPREPQERLT